MAEAMRVPAIVLRLSERSGMLFRDAFRPLPVQSARDIWTLYNREATNKHKSVKHRLWTQKVVRKLLRNIDRVAFD